jgi:acetyltransferase-like isoleucine patch superfamily enzyme
MGGISILKMTTIGLLPSSFKKKYYQLRGAKIGKKVKFGIFSYLNCKNIKIGDYSTIGSFCNIQAKRISIGKRVVIKMLVNIDTEEVIIGNDAVIMEQVLIYGVITPRSKIIIGDRVKIFPFSILNPTDNLTIENDAVVGGENAIFTHSAYRSILEGYPVSYAPIVIKEGAWLPWGIFVGPGVTIGEYSVVGARSVVTKDIPARSLAIGSPAKVVKTEEQFIKKLSIEDKNSIMIKILTEFVELLNYKRILTTVEKTDSSFILNIKGQKCPYLFYSIEIKDFKDSKVVISMSIIEEELRNLFFKKRVIWFDLAKKETVFSRTTIWNEVSSFLSRYGIRFKILDNYEI